MSDDLDLAPISTREIARRYRESHERILSWIHPGVTTAEGVVRLVAERVHGPEDVWSVRPVDLLAFLRRRRGEEVPA